jgi:putative transposase
MVRKRGGRKRALGMGAPIPAPLAPNDRWSLDFISDQFICGRRFRILAVFDDCTRECLAAIADTSLSGLRVARERDLLIAWRGRPKTIVSDNGTEPTSNAILCWAEKAKVDWHYIEPGKPVQNAFVESFNGRLRDEFLKVIRSRNGSKTCSWLSLCVCNSKSDRVPHVVNQILCDISNLALLSQSLSLGYLSVSVNVVRSIRSSKSALLV